MRHHFSTCFDHILRASKLHECIFFDDYMYCQNQVNIIALNAEYSQFPDLIG